MWWIDFDFHISRLLTHLGSIGIYGSGTWYRMCFPICLLSLRILSSRLIFLLSNCCINFFRYWCVSLKKTSSAYPFKSSSLPSLSLGPYRNIYIFNVKISWLLFGMTDLWNFDPPPPGKLFSDKINNEYWDQSIKFFFLRFCLKKPNFVTKQTITDWPKKNFEYWLLLHL